MPLLSVIIPTWNEAPLIVDAVQRAARVADEVIVVDGGSDDESAALAQAAGAQVVHSAKSRGVQLHAGAQIASGDVLLFLHADVRLPPAARDAILGALRDPLIVGGNFAVEFLPASRFTRLLGRVRDWQRRFTRRYYGDSALFVRRDAYRALGGFRPDPLMEDFEFSARLERAGRCVCIHTPSACASARRFRGRELRTLAQWTLLHLLYWSNAPGNVLARVYADARDDDPRLYMSAYRKHFRDQAAFADRRGTASDRECA